ncbi:polyprenol phosphomannose-dependent alpha 1,6 mannosyltransferase MptB [Jiangella sp. DSM 45060]|uniref:polyprenol phosphomannose-dependent alpha 1,6 mannosyltransferase MptB n=1 Tax=Jiangella sp. DSM 45060 TaxID=1798224 RepID=UPI00087C5826|nr:polyprenol phosphomannose-dependent alpha 1,6 mannosyltransferase MptB [Jiangella sp. DSM 45060]SDT43334.1 alpha-1,6-mannosyltransferase [Jiangella sp. DSM 45060]
MSAVAPSGSPRATLVAGAAASATVVVAVTLAGPIPGVVLPDGPLGLWRAAGDGRPAWALLAVAAIATLSLLFVRLYLLARDCLVDVRFVARAAAAWTAPVLLAQPILSLDAYSYVAQGRLLDLGIDPYTTGPIVFGAGPLLDPVAPVWRMTPAPYGPLSLTLLGWSADVTGARHVPFVLLLRVLAIVAVVVATVAAARLARPGARAAAVALVAANPVVVLHLIGGVHLDVLVGALAPAVLLAVRKRWWWLAALAAAGAFALKLPGLVLVGYVLWVRFRRPERRWAGTAAVLTVTAAVTLGAAAVVPDGWGWIAALDTPGRVELLYTVPAAVAGVAYGLTMGGVGFGALLDGSRVLCAAAGAALIGWLVVRAGHPSTPVRRAGALAGGALVVLALAAPVVHAWYLAWALPLLAAGAGVVGQRWLIGLSVALCFSALPDPLTRWHHGLLPVTLLLLAATLALTFWWLADARRRPPGERADAGAADLTVSGAA